MTPQERQEFIRGMVAQLEDRLATDGGSPEEWGRLISSLVVVGQEERAKNIWAEAQSTFAASPEALAMLRAVAENAGLGE